MPVAATVVYQGMVRELEMAVLEQPTAVAEERKVLPVLRQLLVTAAVG
jgi:hypothetical protein